ncbi:MAG: hypothetical protein GKR87_11230 [Kiritimatiellae bacterium]|nr:hypothetical protein [Kiritimatiellia bacterium]
MHKIITFLIIGFMATNLSYGAMLSQGTGEVSIDGILDFDTANGSLFSMHVGSGKFFWDGIEIGLKGGFSIDDRVESIGLGVFTEYDFDNGTEMVPFVGISLDYEYVEIKIARVDESSGALVLGFNAGLKYFLVENVALAGKGELRFATDDVFAEDNGVGATDFRFTLGLRFFY